MTTTPETKTKAIAYAYPTSDNARQFRFARTGCYAIELRDGTEPPVAIAGYATIEEACRIADLRPEPYGQWDLVTYRDSRFRHPGGHYHRAQP